MYYEQFRNSLIENHGDLFAEVQTAFFAKAVEAGRNGYFEDAMVLAEDAMVFAKYSNTGYSNIYLAGLLCQCYLDNGLPEKANRIFEKVMPYLDKNDENYGEDVDSFLDLKIAINKALNTSLL